jgi:Uncharacterised nucleotidyltransferase
MTSPDVKFAVFRALQAKPDFSPLAALDRLSARARGDLLAWLDRSGLSLYLLDQIERHARSTLLPADLSAALGEKTLGNLRRSKDMWAEYLRVNASFEANGVRVATLKGFSLVPDYCASSELRHQTDFDFLVDPDSVVPAANALRSCGYLAKRLSTSGESYFTTPSDRAPRAGDDIFDLQRHRQIDLHVAIWDPVEYFDLEVPSDCLAKAQPRTIRDRKILCLTAEDQFLLQACHVFKHMLRSWIRASWLFEMSRFLATRQDPEFWRRVEERAGDSATVRRALALVLLTVEEVFGGAAPERIHRWLAPAVTARLRTWVRHCAREWAAADWPGSLSNLPVAREFARDPAAYRRYLVSRIRPARARLSIGEAPGHGLRLGTRLANAGYLALRARKHLSELARLPLTLLRWNRAVRASASTPSEFIEVGGADVHAKEF